MLSETLRKKSIEGLNPILKSEYELSLMTLHYHWNVEGSDFYTLHDLLGRQYKEIIQVVDDLAERVRALGFYVALDTSLKFSIKDVENLKAKDMIQNLLSKREELVQKIRLILKDIKEDEVTEEFLVDRLSVHESAIWGLKSLLK